MSKHVDEHHGETSVRAYVFIGIVLAIITYIEYVIVEYEYAWLSREAVLIWLIILSVAKFLLVVMYFMHLKQDDRTYTGFFTSGMVIALGTFIALSLLFTIRAVAWQVQDQPPVQHELVGITDLAHAEHVYDHYCAMCHGATGTGVSRAIPPHVGHAPALVQAEGGVGGRRHMIHVVLYGLEGPIEALGRTYDGLMPSRANLSDRDIAYVLNYTVHAFGNDALLPADFQPFSASEVAEARGQALVPADVHALRQELVVPDVDIDALLLRQRRLAAASWRPAPKDLSILIHPEREATEYRTPIAPEAGLINRDLRRAPLPGSLVQTPQYERPGEQTGIGSIPQEFAADAATVGHPQSRDLPRELGDIRLRAPAADERFEEPADEELPAPEAEEAEEELGAPEADVADDDVEVDAPEAGDVEVDEPADAEADADEPDAMAPDTADPEATDPEATDPEATPEATAGAAAGAIAALRGAATPTATDEGVTEEADADVEPEEDAEPEEPATDDAVAAEAAAFDWQALGQTTYANCVGCHGPAGAGIPGAFPPLADHAADILRADGGRAYYINVMLYGLQGQIVVNGQSYNGIMPPWPQLSDEQIAAVINHTAFVLDDGEGVTPIVPREVEEQRGQGLAPAQVLEQRQALDLE